MTIATSTTWQSVSQIPADAVAVAEFFYGDESKSIKIAERDMEIGTEHYLGILKIIPVTNYGLSLKSNEYSIANMQMQIDNLEYEPGKRFSDLFTELGTGSDIGIDNRQVDLRWWREGITSFDDCLPLFPNGISRRPASNRKLLIQDVDDRTEVNLRKVFTDVLEDADAADPLSGLPSESRGKISPVTYGDHTTNRGDDSKTLDTVSTANNNMYPIVYLGQAIDGRHWWQVAQTTVFELLPNADDGDWTGQIWGHDDDLNRLVRLALFVVENNDDVNGCQISHNNDTSFFDYWYSNETVTPTDSGGSGVTGFANSGRMGDKAFDTASTGSLATNAGDGTWIEADVSFAEYDGQVIDDSNISSIQLLVYAKMTFGGGGAYDRTEATGFAWEINSSVQPFGVEDAQYPDERYFRQNLTGGSPGEIVPDPLSGTKANIELDTTIRITKNTALAESISVDIYETYKLIRYSPKKIIPLFFAGQGKEYDFLTGRTNHADFAAGDGSLIRNPAGSAESVLRLGPGLGTSDLDTASFDTASNSLSALKADFAFINPITSKKFLADIGYQFRSYLWYQPDGTIKMQVLEDTYETANRIIRYRDILALDFPETESDILYTKVRVLYDWDGSGFQSRTTYSEAATSQTKYSVDGDQTEKSIEGFLIHDPTTAEAIRDFFLAQWKNVHNIAVVTVGAIHLDLDIGDIIQLNDVPYEANGIDISQNDTKAGQAVYPFWLIYDVRRSNTLTFKAIQLHNLTT